MAMDKMETRDEVIELAKRRGVTAGRVKNTAEGTNLIQFTKGDNPRVEKISWDEFFTYLQQRGLAVYKCDTWMKIMKA